MDLNRSLFYGSKVCLAPIQPEQDAEVESRWTHSADYLRMFGNKLVRPLSPLQVKKAYEEFDKPGDQGKNQFYFTIRLLPDERFLGFAKIYSIAWSHGVGRVQLGVGDVADRCKGYGSEALGLLLRYAFEEINLYRLSAWIPDYNQPALQLFGKAGFHLEVRQRQLLQHDGYYWDMLGSGLLRSEWLQRQDSSRMVGGEQ